MLSRGLLLTLPLAGAALALGPHEQILRLRDEAGTAFNETAATKKFIVEVDASDSGDVVAELNSRPGTKVLKQFNSDIFTGVSVETEELNVDTLQDIAPVKKAWPMKLVALDKPGRLQTFSDDTSAGEYSTHGATGVDKLHDAGVYGEGAVVAVVDTGIEYTHPALGGCFGEGCKVASGYDFVGDTGEWPYTSLEKHPDGDPMDNMGHGTHVSGIIAGVTGSWSGVAPNATLMGLKVFDHDDYTYEDTLIEAFLYAYHHDVDVITASIGGPDGWSTNVWGEVASRIVDSGIVVTIAAGNSGSNGPFWGSSGAMGPHVLGVASVEAEEFPAQPFKATFSLDGQSNETTAGYIPATYNFPTNITDWPIVPVDFNLTSEASACEPLSNGTQDLSNVIPLVRRGTCTFATKQQNLQEFGARYILIYNNENALVSPYTEEEGSLFGIITADAGKAVIETVLAGGSVTADFSPHELDVVGLENMAGGKPSDFTEWGGSYDLQSKPEIAAPGGDIFSTYIGNTFAVLSGTSMATPYVAGVAALYIGAHGGKKTHGKDFAKMLHMRIISSGSPLPWYNGVDTSYEFVAPVPQVGNGLVDAFKVVNYATRLGFGKFDLNDTLHFRDSQGVTITNTGSETLKYAFSVRPAAGFEAMEFPDPDTYFSPRLKQLSDLTPTTFVPDVELPSGSFTLGPGQSGEAKFQFSLPEGVNSTMLPVYSGSIVITASNGEAVSVPYFGLAADLQKEMDHLFETTFPFCVSGVYREDLSAKSNYTWNLTTFGPMAQDFPIMNVKLKYGAKEVRWDVFEPSYTDEDWRYPPVPGENGFVGSAACSSYSTSSSYFDPSYMDPNSTFQMPEVDVFRNAQASNSFFTYWWLGKMADGSRIPVGSYKIRFAALKPFADPKLASSWDMGKYEGPMPVEVLEPDVYTGE